MKTQTDIIRIKNKKGLMAEIKDNWQLYAFLIIPIVYIVIFAYGPMAGLQIAFKKFEPRLGIWGSEWIGVGNFIKFFASYQFMRILKNTLFLSLYALIAGFPVPIIFAMMINVVKNNRYKKFTQMAVYLPHFISVVVLVGMIHQLFNPIMGLYANLYQTFMGGGYPPDILANAQVFPHLYVWSGIWQNMGWNSIIYLAALSSVDAELHEAAQIDGASRLKRIIHIDFPCILPTAVILLILNVGSIMNVGFEKVLLMQNSLNLQFSEVISTYVYKVGIASGGGDYSYATAIGFFNSVINFAMIVSVNAITKRLGDLSLW